MGNLVEIVLIVILVVIMFHVFNGTKSHVTEYISSLGSNDENKCDDENMIDNDEDLDGDSQSSDQDEINIMPNDNNTKWATLKESTAPLIRGSKLSNAMCGVDVSGINLDTYVKTTLENYAFGNSIMGENGFHDDKFETGATLAPLNDNESYSIEGSVDSAKDNEKYRAQHFDFYDKINGSSNDAFDPVDRINTYLFTKNTSSTNIQDIYDGMVSNR